MSLYNAIMGENPAASMLLKMLGLTRQDVPRYRDCWATTDWKQITLLTRTGGGNRPDYEVENEALRAIPGFISDHDDEADGTFAHFVYSTEGKRLAVLDGNDAERGPAFMMKAIQELMKSGLHEPHPNAKLEAIRQASIAVGRRVVDGIERAMHGKGGIVRIGGDDTKS